MLEGLHKIVSSDETIVAISTAAGRSAIGMVRLSGAEASVIARRLFRTTFPLEHRRASVGTWFDPDGNALDEVVVTLAESPHSYTGEDLVEICAHGNPFVLNRIVESILKSGARLAGPGEFTFRAVANGKMDLTQAEAVREFIDAQTEQQARTALRQMEGAASKRLAPVKKELIEVIAHLEAGIDFADDDVDVPASVPIAARLDRVVNSLMAVTETFGYGRMLMEGARITIAGKPNVGKSSLFNRLLASERAIVADTPGTTRDVLTEVINLGGIPLRLADTAGLRETSDHVESMGVGRSLDSLSDAALTLVVLDGSRPLDLDDERVIGKTKGLPHLVVINKSDLPPAFEPGSNGAVPLLVSAISGRGVDELREAILGFFLDRRSGLTDDFVLTSTRQKEDIVRATNSLKAASAAVLADVPHEMVLLDLYAAIEALNELTGDVVTEDILDSIFSTFCIGK